MIVLFPVDSYAATITVNSNADAASDDGQCTLREAIVSSNDDAASGVVPGECSAGSGADTINFAITGTSDFTIDGQSGYTINPQGSVPEITEEVVIDGFTQPGAEPNTAVSPRPMNGILLIEIEGDENVGSLEVTADNSEIRGLVINSFDSAGLLVGGDNVIVRGNYIGVDPTGLIEKENTGNGINRGVTSLDPDDLIIGGSNPEDRNIISGNAESGITPNVGSSGWIIKGNYVGVGADGETPLPNSHINGPGGLSIDNCTDTTVGGSEEGATNVISANNSFGIFPDNTDGLVIQGNIIGPDWKGDEIEDAQQLGGIGFPPIAGPFVDTLIGGTTESEANHIAYNKGGGVLVISMYFNGGLVDHSENISIIGNSIHSNITSDTYVLSSSGLGIDIQNADLGTVSLTQNGPTPNDVGDLDTGSNGFINFPEINSVEKSDSDELIVNYDLDAAGSPVGQYRVEFFASHEPDPSGYGEGEIFLGADTASSASDQQILLQSVQGLDLSGMFISATTTAIDPSIESGFGPTSEFSQVFEYNPNIESQTINATLADTGDPEWVYILLGIALVAGSLPAGFWIRKKLK